VGTGETLGSPYTHDEGHRKADIHKKADTLTVLAKKESTLKKLLHSTGRHF
jgi:hypothetical protein